MIITLLIWLYVALLSYAYGLIAIDVGHAVFKPVKQETVAIATTLLSGLALISCLTSYLFIGLNIGLLANLIIIGIALLYFVIRRQTLFQIAIEQIHRLKELLLPQPVFVLGGLIITLLTLLLALRSSLDLFYFDTGLYHLQYISWAEQYPAVPGLGNLHTRLAFNSQWLLLSTLFDGSFIFKRPILTLNALVLLIALLSSFLSLKKILERNIKLPNLFQALLLVPLCSFIYNYGAPLASSPSTDLPACIAIFSSLALMLVYLDRDAEGKDTRLLASFLHLIIGFAITIKLSSIPIGLFVPYSLYRECRKHGIRQGLLSLFPLAFIGIPFLITNVILSGYLIYPISKIDIFNFDWKVPNDIAKLTQMWSRSWIRKPWFPPDQVLAMRMEDWFFSWFQDFENTLEYQCLAGLAIILFIHLVLQPRVLIKAVKPYLLVCGLLVSGLLFWFNTSPNLRFGLGLIWGLIAFFAATLLTKPLQALASQKKLYQLATYPVTFSVLVVMLHQPIVKTNESLQNFSFLIFPSGYPAVATNQVAVGAKQISQPAEGFLCWNSGFPCTPYPNGNYELKCLPTQVPCQCWSTTAALSCSRYPDTRLEFRGDSLRQGFRIVKKTEASPTLNR